MDSVISKCMLDGSWWIFIWSLFHVRPCIRCGDRGQMTIPKYVVVRLSSPFHFCRCVTTTFAVVCIFALSLLFYLGKYFCFGRCTTTRMYTIQTFHFGKLHELNRLTFVWIMNSWNIWDAIFQRKKGALFKRRIFFVGVDAYWMRHYKQIYFNNFNGIGPLKNEIRIFVHDRKWLISWVAIDCRW